MGAVVDTDGMEMVQEVRGMLMEFNNGKQRKEKREKEDRLRLDRKDRTHNRINCCILQTWVYLYYKGMWLTCSIRAAPSPLVHAHLSCLLCGLCSDGRLVPATVWLTCVSMKV